MEETPKEDQKSITENKPEDNVSKRALKRQRKREKWLANLPAKR